MANSAVSRFLHTCKLYDYLLYCVALDPLGGCITHYILEVGRYNIDIICPQYRYYHYHILSHVICSALDVSFLIYRYHIGDK